MLHIQIMAELGLLPSWLQTYAKFDHNSRVFQWYADRFSLRKSKASACRMMISIQSGFDTNEGTHLPESTIENLACKNYQRADSRVESKRDLHYNGSPIITRSADNGHMNVTVNRVTVALERKFLIDKWFFGGRMLGMAEIAGLMGLPGALPGARMLTNGNIPQEARAIATESLVSFEIDNWYV